MRCDYGKGDEEKYMKITLKNIEYSDSYKSLAIRIMPQELKVTIPDNTTEAELHNAVFLAIAKQYSPDMAQAIEAAEFVV